MKTAAPDEPAPRRRLDRWRRIVAIAFRVAEVCLVLLFLRWIWSRLPLASHISFNYLSQALSLVSRPAVAFVLSNAIIAAVVAKSGRSTDDDSVDGDGFFDAIIESQPKSRLSSNDDGDDNEEVVVYDDKQILISETSAPASAIYTDDSEDSDTEMEKFPKRKEWREEEEEELRQSSDTIKYRKTGEELHLPAKEELRQSETMKHRKTDEELHLPAEVATAPEDELSSEEFQRTIEAFIAEQLRLRQEESLSIVDFHGR